MGSTYGGGFLRGISRFVLCFFFVSNATFVKKKQKTATKITSKLVLNSIYMIIRCIVIIKIRTNRIPIPKNARYHNV